MRGLRGDYCPECGEEFDRAALPWVDTESHLPHPLANLTFFLAFLIGCFKIGFPPSSTNTIIQLANVAVIWILGGLWAWLRFRDLTDSSRQHVLLWLLLLCYMNADRPGVSDKIQLALQLVSLVVGTILLVYLFFVSVHKTLHCVMLLISAMLIFGGMALLTISVCAAIMGLSEGQSYSILGVHSSAVGDHHGYAAAAGGGYTLLGVALLWITLRKQRAATQKHF